MFLATPHRGTDLADLLNRMLFVSFQSPKDFVLDLSRTSAALEEINEQFRHVAPKMSIFSFYETLPTHVGPKKLVCGRHWSWSYFVINTDIPTDGTWQGIIDTWVSWGGVQISQCGPPRCLQIHQSRRFELRDRKKCAKDLGEKPSIKRYAQATTVTMRSYLVNTHILCPRQV